ncbi:MAG: hypothetical protein DWQ56_14785 [Microcystis aeruginosa DA14]|uniref:Uncharacterized protein n=1 Tax=Microcystis aeruginosa DA14 TaxID=1987506 RepID=A0A3E0M830_MICAE|nr:MAG: hypothetical protein DWQ56_14785 [Microcystis aeruginosa DA14]
MLRPYFFSTENGFLGETRFLLMDTPLIKGGRGDRHPPYQGGQGGSTPPLSRGAGGRTQITRFSITPKLIHLCYSLPKKIPEKGMREKKGKKGKKGYRVPPAPHTTRKPKSSL